MMALQPIDKMGNTLAEAAYNKINEALIAGTLPSGTRLVMDNLAEELDISRTPVRDALLRLEREGLIEPAGRRGYVVREVSFDEIEKIYQAREAIEGYAARKAAEIGEPAIARVDKAIAAGEAFVDNGPAGAYAANRDVHRAVVAALDNPVLLDAFDLVWTGAKSVQAFRDYATHVASTSSLRQDHEPLLDAFRESQEAACDAMIKHIRSGLSIHRN